MVTASFLSNKIDSNKRVQLFQAIERFIFIAFRLTRAISTYRNSEFYKAARKLCNNELSVSDIIDILEERMNYCFNKSEEKSEIYFNHIYFKTFIDKKFKNSGNGGFYYWNGLRYFLYEYEMGKVRDRGSAKIDWELFIKSERDKISIEHIYPQTPNNDCWKINFENYGNGNLKYFQGTFLKSFAFISKH